MVAALQALLVLCHFQFLLTLVRGGHHPHGFNRTVLAELEHLGELYYDEQKDERVYNEAQDFAKVKPNFPCVHGVTPLGSADRSSVVDGHKFACGLHAVSKSPIVYSFGSNQQQDFEMAVLRYRPDARIFVFELIESHLPDKAVQDSRIEYYVLGLGGYPDSEASEYVMKTMEAIMKERKHTYVDIVKMDIEGVEFDFLHTEGQKIVPRIGQLLVELHLHFGYVEKKYPGETAITFVQHCEKYGFRVFNQEVNKLQTQRFTELGLIHHNWTLWDEHKNSLSWN